MEASSSAPPSPSRAFPFDFPSEDSPSHSQPERDHAHPPLFFQVSDLLPTLAHGGGGEALSFSMFASPYEYQQHASGSSQQAQMTVADAWLMNNGFAPFQSSAQQIYPPQQLTPPTPHYSPASDQVSNYPSYSTSGIDLMGLLARVSNRPDKTVSLGPVDDSCAFCICDVRRHDSPIIYCSKSFCELTGYSENELMGRNCRFLQAPPGTQVLKGAPRPHSSESDIRHMAKMLAANKECQYKIINYKKDGTQFVNLISVIPIRGGAIGGDEDTVSFHIGFQADLSSLPAQILQGVNGGRWVGTDVVREYEPPSAKGTIQPSSQPLPHGRPPRIVQIPPQAIAEELRRDNIAVDWLKRMPQRQHQQVGEDGIETLIDRVILEKGPDLVWVVSLKGTFLYVSPAVKRILGYEPEELVGKGLRDIAHPKDIVPLLRELKESCVFTDSASASSGGGAGGDEENESAKFIANDNNANSTPPSNGEIVPKVVDLMFRATTKSQKYIWIHSRGRLHVEPGKGRKAIILSARGREMGDVCVLSRSVGASGLGIGAECWGTISECGVILSVSGSKEVIGRGDNAVGRRVGEIIGAGREAVDSALRNVAEMMRKWRVNGSRMAPQSVSIGLAKAEGGLTDGVITLYPVKSSCPFRNELSEGDRGMGVDSRRVAEKPSFGTSVSSETNGVVSSPHIVFQIYTIPFEPSPSCGTPGQEVPLFEELGVERDSSWQYELQQIKFANERLKEEIRSLEGMLGIGGDEHHADGRSGISIRRSSPSMSTASTASPSSIMLPPTAQSSTGATTSPRSPSQQQLSGGYEVDLNPRSRYYPMYYPPQPSSSSQLDPSQSYSGYNNGFGYSVQSSLASTTLSKRPWHIVDAEGG